MAAIRRRTDILAIRTEQDSASGDVALANPAAAAGFRSSTNPKVDAFLSKAKNWREEMEKLKARSFLEVT